MSDAIHNTLLEVDESTPLIQSQAEPAVGPIIPEDHDVAAADEDRPLPMGQITVLCFARFCETLSFFVILPYVFV